MITYKMMFAEDIINHAETHSGVAILRNDAPSSLGKWSLLVFRIIPSTDYDYSIEIRYENHENGLALFTDEDPIMLKYLDRMINAGYRLQR